jgi:hypothetical protein
MTRSEAAKVKSDYIDERQAVTKKKFSALEKKLYEAIVDKFIRELSVSDGIINSSGQNIKLTAALDKIFKDFSQNQYAKVVAGIGGDMLKINSYNKAYFKKVIDSDFDVNKFDTISKQVDYFMAKRIGVKEDGSIEKKGYLDRLIKDEAVKNKVKQSVLQAITNRKPISDFIKETRVLIEGDDVSNGQLVRYFNNYVRDTYSQFDRTSGQLYASKIGIRCFIYQGGIIEDSRKFCKKRDGKVFTTDEAVTWANLTGDDAPIWSTDLGEYNPLVDCGGINCRHSIDYISNSLAIRLRPDLKGKI